MNNILQYKLFIICKNKNDEFNPSFVNREERDALIARQIALSLEREEQMRERELREQMRLQLWLDDEAAKLEAEKEIQRRIQEEKDQVSKVSILAFLFSLVIHEFRSIFQVASH